MVPGSGSARDDVKLEVLRVASRQRLVAGQDELDLGLKGTEPARRVLVVCCRSRRRECALWDALPQRHDELGSTTRPVATKCSSS